MDDGGDGEKVLEGEKEEKVGLDMKPCFIMVETSFDFNELSPPIELN